MIKFEKYGLYKKMWMELGLDGTKVKILSEIRPHLEPTASGACLRCHIVKNSPTNFTAIYGIICG